SAEAGAARPTAYLGPSGNGPANPQPRRDAEPGGRPCPRVGRARRGGRPGHARGRSRAAPQGSGGLGGRDRRPRRRRQTAAAPRAPVPAGVLARAGRGVPSALLEVSRPEGRHVVVTGAGRGIGKAIALRLARDGARLSLLARGEDALAATADELGGAFTHGVDIRDAQQ